MRAYDAQFRPINRVMRAPLHVAKEAKFHLKKTVLRKVCSVRKLSKYSLLREKVLELPYVLRLLPLHRWIKTNCKLCLCDITFNSKLKFLNLKLLARADWKNVHSCIHSKCTRVYIQTNRFWEFIGRQSRYLVLKGCSNLRLIIILSSKRRLFWLSRKPEWITDTSISVEACPGDAKCRPTGRSLLVCRVESKCSLNRSPRRLPVSPM